ncbi:embryo defective 2410 [Actinidia rufa]|uniref:Embryo defective 2410 n=1 Tax=Actinidia rufa TaxID=165716 RepID=A0A7J0DXR4_9ERIC|nr:embryo defective 2410 [Actinidia rufa]
MSTILHCQYLGFPLQCPVNRGNNGNLVYVDRVRLPKRDFRCTCAKQNYWVSQGIRFSHFCGRNAEFLWKNLGWRGWVGCETGNGALFWGQGFGQAKAKTYAEAKLLPSLCSVLSEYIHEVFSCGEVPTIKLRVLPFASLRKGQDCSLQRHLSTEEGIDHRTKTKRIAREETATHFGKQRDDAAREAADMGYILSEKGSCKPEVATMKGIASHPAGLATSEPFFHIDERLHWQDHHCMDAGIEYDFKHADLEKAFGVKIPGSGAKFWSRFIPGAVRRKFKKKANGRDISATGVTAKRRILERSASAALEVESENSAHPSVRTSYEECVTADYQIGAVKFGGKQNPEHGKVEASGDCLTSGGISELENKAKIDLELGENSGRLLEIRNSMDKFSSITGVAASQKTDSCDVHDGDLGVDGFSRHVGSPSKSSRLEDQRLESLDNTSDGQGGHRSLGSTFIKSEHSLAMNHSIAVWPLSLKLGLLSFHISMKELSSYYVVGPVQKLKLEMGLKAEDIIAELIDGVDDGQASVIEKMLPVTLDSVHFNDGMLMLLAYGDNELR